MESIWTTIEAYRFFALPIFFPISLVLGILEIFESRNIAWWNGLCVALLNRLFLIPSILDFSYVCSFVRSCLFSIRSWNLRSLTINSNVAADMNIHVRFKDRSFVQYAILIISTTEATSAKTSYAIEILPLPSVVFHVETSRYFLHKAYFIFGSILTWNFVLQHIFEQGFTINRTWFAHDWIYSPNIDITCKSFLIHFLCIFQIQLIPSFFSSYRTNIPYKYYRCLMKQSLYRP